MVKTNANKNNPIIKTRIVKKTNKTKKFKYKIPNLKGIKWLTMIIN
ncbi:hypothetical protein HYU09_04490 [Candidatus Woesearchaeota archaeon]|nr:hypothetical protein [Candidatus Woesearchaeota archaeon]